MLAWSRVTGRQWRRSRDGEGAQEGTGRGQHEGVL